MYEPVISPATLSDIPELLPLINSAFRGDASRKGWTTEADLLAGDLRIDADGLAALLNKETAVILKYRAEGGGLQGCVYLENRHPDLYLGMLTVSPELQAQGIGKKLLAVAEAHARAQGCAAIVMRVFTKRPELIAWYLRHGYADTGRREPFEVVARFGLPSEPMEFMILKKAV